MARIRKIDLDERKREKPMRVLVLGMCRTGTTSISSALRKLGYTPHQMRDVLVRPQEIALWQEAIDLTLLSNTNNNSISSNNTAPQTQPQPHQKQPYTTPDFDKLLSTHDAALDIPSCIFASHLIAAYPDAKVLLTTRKYSAWEASMRESIWCLDTWYLFVACRVLNITQLAPLTRLVHSVFKVHSGNAYGGPHAEKCYEQHYDTVRELVPEEKLLEIDMDNNVEWDTLCGFLGDKVPDEPFPRLNEEKAMRRNLENAWWGMVRYLVLMVVLPALVTTGAVLVYVHADEVRGWRDERVLGPFKAYLDG